MDRAIPTQLHRAGFLKAIAQSVRRVLESPDRLKREAEEAGVLHLDRETRPEVES